MKLFVDFLALLTINVTAFGTVVDVICTHGWGLGLLLAIANGMALAHVARPIMAAVELKRKELRRIIRREE